MGKLESLFFYYFIFSITALFFWVGKTSKSHCYRYFFLFISVLIPTFISGLRYNVGIDYGRYHELFRIIKITPAKELVNGIIGFKVDKTFLFLSKFFLTFSSVEMYFAILTFITVGLMVIALCEQRYEKYNTALGFFLYMVLFFGEALNNVRQFVSISIGFFALRYVFVKNYKRFLFCVVIALFFHLSAILILPMYVLWNQKFDSVLEKKYYVICVLVAILILIYWREIILILDILGILPAIRSQQYSAYSAHSNRDFYVKFLIVSFVLLFSRHFKDKTVILFTYMMVIGLILSAVGFQVGHLKRIAYYYEIALIIPLPYTQRFFGNLGSRYIYKSFVSMMALSYFAVNYYVLGHSMLIPYQMSM